MINFAAFDIAVDEMGGNYSALWIIVVAVLALIGVISGIIYAIRSPESGSDQTQSTCEQENDLNQKV